MKRISIFYLVFVVALSLPAADKKGDTPKPATAEPAGEEAPPPKTLEEAHQQLEKLFGKDELAKIDAMKSEEEMIMYHFGLGMGMRNSWGLWGGGPLAEHMNKLGFHHPDDMSGVILETFWCKRHKKDFRLKERSHYYAAYWKAAANPPETAKDPNDNSDVIWKMSFGITDEKTPRQIHVGKSKKTGRWLAYEHDKGVYEPDEALMKDITERNPPENPAPPGKTPAEK
jgi:hypothetical protein